MNERWYGDDRDLVKWATLVHLATKYRLRTVIQVGLVRPNGTRPRIISGATTFEVQEAVWKHFRNLLDITRLAASTGIKIVVIGEAFNHRGRERYFEQAESQVRAVRGPQAGVP